MPKTITIRLNDENYLKFKKFAFKENRSIANLIETLAVKKLNEDLFVDNFEMEEIMDNKSLLEKLKMGHAQAIHKKGKMIG